MRTRAASRAARGVSGSSVTWMLAMLMLFVVVGSAMAQAGATTAAVQPYRIHGVVVSARNRAPVPRCHVSAQLEGTRFDRRQGGDGPTMVTGNSDAEGRFSLDLPAAGMWQLSAIAPGFRRQLYEQHEEFSSAVVLTEGMRSAALVFRLEPDSSVTGLVLDEAAEPVRNATVSLVNAATLNPEVASGVGARRESTTTDDRGRYELAGVSPGEYRVSVQGRPWYAAAVTGMRSDLGRAATVSSAARDAVYPLTWFPGALEPEAGSTLRVRGGETKQANFNLLPVPAARVRLPGAAANVADRMRSFPMVTRLDGGQPGVSGSMSRMGDDGQMEIGGLEPGLYRIDASQPGGSTSTFLRVQAGSTMVASSADAVPAAEITVHFVGDDSATGAQVMLTDTVSGIVYRGFNGGGFGLRRRPEPPGRSTAEEDGANRTMQVPAGRYQVALVGGSDLYLNGISVGAGVVKSRVVALGSGAVTLTLEVAHGRGEVKGFVVQEKQPLAGAMVMLVPASFGQTGSIDLLRRDQSNSDGSFDLAGVLPGEYILLAIANGWETNWHNPATLEHFLLGGTPLLLEPGAQIKQQISAQSP